MASVSVHDISFGSLAKLGFFASASLWLVLGLLMGIGGMANVIPVTMNNAPAVGFSAFVTSIFIALMFTLFQTLGFLAGVAIWRASARFTPDFRLSVKAVNSPSASGD